MWIYKKKLKFIPVFPFPYQLLMMLWAIKQIAMYWLGEYIIIYVKYWICMEFAIYKVDIGATSKELKYFWGWNCYLKVEHI